MSVATIDQVLIAHNPATGQALGSITATPPDEIGQIIRLARAAQAEWSRTTFRERSMALDRWRVAMARDADGWARAIRDEVGKPLGEALGEAISTFDAIHWTARHGREALADQRLGVGRQRWMLVKPTRLSWRPFGVIGMIGTWNYPLLLNAPTIAQALFAGNAVVWKPSELAPALGQRLCESLTVAGFPAGLVATIQGGGEIGAALASSNIDKMLFTGGIENGRRVLGDLARRGVPAVAEFSGFDAAIVLPDAPLDSTADALVWAAFVGAGQTCVAVKRVLVVGDPIIWADALTKRARALRVGNPSTLEVDVGPLISETARARFDASIRNAEAAGARLITGGRALNGPGWFYAPTVLLADDPEAERVLSGCFGPVVLVRGFPNTDAALDAANASPFGLAASVWGRDSRETRHVAERLEAGMVTINDAVTPSAHASAPFGGVKSSGFGRTKGALGLREFAQPQTLQSRRAGGIRPQLFPYSARVIKLMAGYIRLFHRE